jgi:hypothetical protein
MAGKLDPVEFGQAADLLEEIRVDLNNSMADYFVQSLAEADGGTVPDEVKHASREAFRTSGMHGFAAAAMDSHEHNRMAAAAHGKAAMLAKKHGLVVLAHTHRVKEAGHHKAAKAAASDTEESRQPVAMMGVGRPKKVKKESKVPGPAMGVGRPKKPKREAVGYRTMGSPGAGMRPTKPKKESIDDLQEYQLMSRADAAANANRVRAMRKKGTANAH